MGKNTNLPRSTISRTLNKIGFLYMTSSLHISRASKAVVYPNQNALRQTEHEITTSKIAFRDVIGISGEVYRLAGVELRLP